MLTHDIPASSVKIGNNEVLIGNLKIEDADLSSYLEKFPAEDMGLRVIHLIEVGLSCIQRAQVIQDRDFMQTQMNSVISSVERVLMTLPGMVKEKMLNEIGSGEGQVLHPVEQKIGEANSAIKERMEEVRNFLRDDIDPTKETSKVGMVFGKLEKILDPDYVNSVQHVIEKAVKDVTAEDGTLTKNVKAVVSEAILPLQREVDTLSKDILGRDAIADALQETTLKGQEYEYETVNRLSEWCSFNGVELHHVGTDNRAGDILVKPGSAMGGEESVTIVIETRDRQRPKGRKQIDDDMQNCMQERGAQYGIYLSKTRDGLANEIGDWAEGIGSHGPWVATTDEYALNAVRFLISMHRLNSLGNRSDGVDIQSLAAQVERITTSMRHISTINKKAAAIRDGANDIQSEGQMLRDEVKDSLRNVEEALNSLVDSTDMPN